jgi:hypothetical protein
MVEACKIAITTPGMAEMDLNADAYSEIGQEIFLISKPDEKEVEDFSEAPEDKS